MQNNLVAVLCCVLPHGQKPELLILMVVCMQDGLALSLPAPSYTKTPVTGNVATT
jgi:hypothetical protein